MAKKMDAVREKKICPPCLLNHPTIKHKEMTVLLSFQSHFDIRKEVMINHNFSLRTINAIFSSQVISYTWKE